MARTNMQAASILGTRGFSSCGSNSSSKLMRQHSNSKKMLVTFLMFFGMSNSVAALRMNSDSLDLVDGFLEDSTISPQNPAPAPMKIFTGLQSSTSSSVDGGKMKSSTSSSSSHGMPEVEQKNEVDDHVPYLLNVIHYVVPFPTEILREYERIISPESDDTLLKFSPFTGEIVSAKSTRSVQALSGKRGEILLKRIVQEVAKVGFRVREIQDDKELEEMLTHERMFLNEDRIESRRSSSSFNNMADGDLDFLPTGKSKKRKRRAPSLVSKVVTDGAAKKIVDKKTSSANPSSFSSSSSSITPKSPKQPQLKQPVKKQFTVSIALVNTQKDFEEQKTQAEIDTLIQDSIAVMRVKNDLEHKKSLLPQDAESTKQFSDVLQTFTEMQTRHIRRIGALKMESSRQREEYEKIGKKWSSVKSARELSMGFSTSGAFSEGSSDSAVSDGVGRDRGVSDSTTGST